MQDTLGKNLMESAPTFETATTELISAKAQFLQKLTDLNLPGRMLLHTNARILSAISNRRRPEEAIVIKIENGTDIHSTM